MHCVCSTSWGWWWVHKCVNNSLHSFFLVCSLHFTLSLHSSPGLQSAAFVLYWPVHHFVFVKQLSSHARVILPSQSVPSSGTTQETCGKRRWSLFSELYQLKTTYIVINLVSLKLINYLLTGTFSLKKPLRSCAVIVIQSRFVYHGCLSVDCSFPCLPSPLPSDSRACHESLALSSPSRCRRTGWVRIFLSLPNRRTYVLFKNVLLVWKLNGSYFLESKWEKMLLAIDGGHVDARSHYSWGLIPIYDRILIKCQLYIKREHALTDHVSIQFDKPRHSPIIQYFGDLFFGSSIL